LVTKYIVFVAFSQLSQRQAKELTTHHDVGRTVFFLIYIGKTGIENFYIEYCDPPPSPPAMSALMIHTHTQRFKTFTLVETVWYYIKESNFTCT